MKMTVNEINFLNKIVAESGKEESDVKHILRSIFICLIKQIYTDYDNSSNKDSITTEFFLPYFGKFLYKCKNYENVSGVEEYTKVKVDMELSNLLQREITRIFNNETLALEDDFKKQITLYFYNILDFEKDEQIEN